MFDRLQAQVDIKLFVSSACPIFARVVNVRAGDVSDGDRRLEHLFEICDVVDCATCIVNSLLPFLNLPSSGWGEAVAPQGAFKVLHHSLGNANKVPVAHRVKVDRDEVSEGVEAVNNFRHWVCILLVKPINPP